MQEIGTVISTLEGPSSGQFSFVIREVKGIPIRKGQFVQLETEEGLLVARVSEIVKTNRYFMRAESVKEYEKDGRPLLDMFPVDRWEYLVANAIPLGIYAEGMQKRVSFPPSPGQKVFAVDEKILFEFLGLDKERGLNIGEVEFHNIPTQLNITKLFQKHCAILSQTGFGKSHLVSVLIEELLERNEQFGKPAIIVADPHGEYTGFAEDGKYISRTKVFDENSLSIAAFSLSANQICEFQPFISSVERRELNKIIEKLRREKNVYDMNDLIDAVDKSEIKPNTKAPLVAWLEDLNSIKLFSNVDSPALEELAAAGQLTALDLSGFIHLRDKQIVVTYIAKKLFEARRANKIPPFIFIVEEAHQFAPEQEQRSGAISKSIIETIAREGRKFCASLVLVSQRPIQLSTTALSQCNSHIILRVSNPYDLDHIGRSCEGLSGDVLKIVTGLKVGEAFVLGEVVNYPLLVKVRDRKSKKSEKGAKLEDVLLSFKSSKARSKEDLKQFM
jgi:DNA helicase HerA-like ATPase